MLHFFCTHDQTQVCHIPHHPWVPQSRMHWKAISWLLETKAPHWLLGRHATNSPSASSTFLRQTWQTSVHCNAVTESRTTTNLHMHVFSNLPIEHLEIGLRGKRSETVIKLYFPVLPWLTATWQSWMHRRLEKWCQGRLMAEKESDWAQVQSRIGEDKNNIWRWKCFCLLHLESSTEGRHHFVLSDVVALCRLVFADMVRQFGSEMQCPILDALLPHHS